MTISHTTKLDTSEKMSRRLKAEVSAVRKEHKRDYSEDVRAFRQANPKNSDKDFFFFMEEYMELNDYTRDIFKERVNELISTEKGDIAFRARHRVHFSNRTLPGYEANCPTYDIGAPAQKRKH